MGQTGTLDLGIAGSNMTAMSMEAPLVPPEAPPEYTSPEERAQVLELTWAEQVALNNSERLQEYELKSFDIPEELGIAFQPEDVAEMQTIPKAFKIYAKDSKGKQVSELGDPTDPWTALQPSMTSTLISQAQDTFFNLKFLTQLHP